MFSLSEDRYNTTAMPPEKALTKKIAEKEREKEKRKYFCQAKTRMIVSFRSITSLCILNGSAVDETYKKLLLQFIHNDLYVK